jgi:hypothetical protein
MWIWICFGIFVCFLVANAIHELRRGHAVFPAEATSGRYKGRIGNVVSHFPFDMRVTLNAAATEEEKQQLIQKKLADNCGWKMPEEAEHSGEDVVKSVEFARSYLRVWGWQIKKLPVTVKTAKKVTGVE